MLTLITISQKILDNLAACAKATHDHNSILEHPVFLQYLFLRDIVMIVVDVQDS